MVGGRAVNANDPTGNSPESIASLVLKLSEKGIDGVEKLIARRPWRVAERDAVEQAAAKGPNGGFICPGCGDEIFNYDINHLTKWGETQKGIIKTLDEGGNITRSEVRDMYGKNIQMACIPCNRGDNKLASTVAGVTAAGASGAASADDTLFGLSSSDVVDLLLPIPLSKVEGGTLYGAGTPYPTYSDYVNSTGAGNGGFLLYPNKPNTNMMRSVYAK